jgi:membrane protein insertase Oxa1/YidC/SpoIIIJ
MYWITSNMVTLVQNYLIYHHGPGRKAPAATSAESDTANPDGPASGRNGARAAAGHSESEAGTDEGNAAQTAKVAKRKRRKKKKR